MSPAWRAGAYLAGATLFAASSWMMFGSAMPLSGAVYAAVAVLYAVLAYSLWRKA